MSKKISINVRINGRLETLVGYPMERLLDVIRIHAGLTGTKEGCGEGECGACSVLINGEIVTSCLVPLAQVEGAEITTIEGACDKDKSLSRVQDSFLKCGGAQCGICTPGMILATENLLRNNPEPTDQEIREALAGNLCRCTGYTRIFESVREAVQS